MKSDCIQILRLSCILFVCLSPTRAFAFQDRNADNSMLTLKTAFDSEAITANNNESLQLARLSYRSYKQSDLRERIRRRKRSSRISNNTFRYRLQQVRNRQRRKNNLRKNITSIAGRNRHLFRVKKHRGRKP